MANVFARIDGFLGRLVCRAVGCVSALMTLAAGWAALDSATPWEVSRSLVALVMFGTGAVIAGCVTRWCFSRERTLGDVIAAIDGDATDPPSPRRRQRAREAGSLEPR